MGRVFKSGAFLRQCLEAHGQDIRCGKFDPPSTISFICKECDITSQVTLPQGAAGETDIQHFLKNCIEGHSAAIRIETMKVEQATFSLHCGKCRTWQRFKELDFESTLSD